MSAWQDKLQKKMEALKLKKDSIKQKAISKKKIAKKKHKTTSKRKADGITVDSRSKVSSPAKVSDSNSETTAASAASTIATHTSEVAKQQIEVTQKLEERFTRILKTGVKSKVKRHEPSDKLTRAICQIVKQGNFPETAARACGIQAHTFRHWLSQGIEDIMAEEATSKGKRLSISPYAIFVRSIDAADAQAETIDVALINRRINNWQALAWLMERRRFNRWGMKSVSTSIQGDDGFTISKRSTTSDQQLTAEGASQVLAALEEAGVVVIKGREDQVGEEVIIDVTGSPAITSVVGDDGEESDIETVTLID